MQVRMQVGSTTTRLGNKGITLHIADNNGKHVGKLRIGQATIEWCKGRTRIGNGKQMRLRRFIDDVLQEM